MKTFIRYFIVTFFIFTFLFTGTMLAYDKIFEPSKPGKNKDGDLITDFPIESEDIETGSFDYMFENSKRVNVLLLGMEGPRTDTIMVASFDPVNKKLEVISIPRDTYYARDGYSSADKKKINAVHGDEDVEGVIKAVREVLLGMPINYYVKVKYDGVEKVVDSLGGVPVYVPMNMRYDDPYDTPPLHINLPKGDRIVTGKEAIHLLRFRKNNDGTGYPDGDIGRIRTQQEFMKAAFKKTLSFRLPIVANTVLKYVKTDIPITEAAKLAASAIGMSSEDLSTYSLPGGAFNSQGLSYWMPDIEQTAAMLEGIYKPETQVSGDNN
ncbi:MAG: LCP family protein [Tissierellia bacterium]|nr:LCP family protein [Tissierellia bacterium]